MAFLGTRADLYACAAPDGLGLRTLELDISGREPSTVAARLDAIAPDVVVALRPERLSPATLDGVSAPVLGIAGAPESLPAPGSSGRRGAAAPRGPELDRVVAPVPPGCEGASGGEPVWRVMAWPVADRLYRELRRTGAESHLLCVGPSTKRRERWLFHPKEQLRITHVQDGLARVPGPERFDIALCIADEGRPLTAEDLLPHLAAGRLVISEPLAVRHGLEPGIDYLEARFPEDMFALATAAQAFPESMMRVRVRGRAKAELFRSSRVWPSLVTAFLDDIAVFGPRRRPATLPRSARVMSLAVLSPLAKAADGWAVYPF